MHVRTFAITWLLAAALAAPGWAFAQAEEAPDSAASTAASSPTVIPPPPVLAAPPTTPPPAIGRERGLVLIPYLGLNLPIDSMADGYSAGARVGVLAGWHMRPRVSLNGEVTFDLMDADGDSSFAHPHEYFLDMGLSPLVHLRSGAIVLGPKLGWFVNRRWQTSDPVVSGNKYLPNVIAHHAQGFSVGVNLGGFVAVGKLNLGMMATVAVRQMVTSSCDDYACGSLVDPIELGLSLSALL